MSLEAIRRRGQGTDDEGIAMILVMGVVVIVTALMVTLLNYTVVSIGHARNEQDTQAALTAAQAGVDDYLSRLNANNVYWQTTDCTNTAMQRVFTAPVPCSWGAGTATGWVPIAGATTPSGSSCSATPVPTACAVYHYDADSSGTIANGTIALKSTGKSKNIRRTVNVSVRRQSFGDFLYFTDYETTDPANKFVFNTTAKQNAAASNCNRHYWDSPARPSTSTCRDIQFGAFDTINGPLHSNDAILIAGTATFNGVVTTGWPTCATANGAAPVVANCYRDADGGSTPNFNKGISYGGDLPLPATNTSLQAQTVTATAYGTAGCGYTGPTRIQFLSNKTMNVWSPYTKTVNAGCGSAPFTTAVQNVTVPQNNVIYVSGVPTSQSTPAAGNCAANAISGQYPQSGDYSITLGDWDCRAGIALVEGVLNGRVTVGAAGNIVITNSLTYQNGTGGGDSLGLIANGSIQVYHPVTCTATSSGVCTDADNIIPPNNGGAILANINIQAAMLALDHGFTVQNYALGGTGLGALNIYGSIGQLYRGAVATADSSGNLANGYTKNYVYDTRLKFAPPPYYLNPVQAKYIAAVFSEVPPAY